VSLAIGRVVRIEIFTAPVVEYSIESVLA